MTIAPCTQRVVAAKPCASEGLFSEEFNKLPRLDEHDWYGVDENPIERAWRYVSSKAEQLHAHKDPLEVLYRSLLSIINYQSSPYSLLYVSGEELASYLPKSPFGEYYYSEEVSTFIEKRICDLKKAYANHPKEQRWKVLKIARQLLPGLALMIEDYSQNSSYVSFKERISELKKALEDFIQKSSREMNREIPLFLIKKGDYDLHGLLNLHADSYPRYLVYECIEKCYGPRLAGGILPKYIENSENTQIRIPYDELYGLLFAIATNVRMEDLKWKYEQLKNIRVKPVPSDILRGLGVVEAEKPKAAMKSLDYLDLAAEDHFSKDPAGVEFEDLSQLQLNRLLAYFRRAPNGMNLLDYFGIPISLDKSNVVETFLSTDCKSIEEQNRTNEIYFYADLESTKIWHCHGIIQMSQIQMFDQLSRLFANPREAQLFHTDRYISFLNVAATAIAYLKSCRNPDEVTARMGPLLDLLNEIVAHAHEMYPKEFVEAYKACWLTLIGKLKDGMRNPTYDFTKYYLNFFVHPLLADQEQKEVLDCHHDFVQREYLARKVGYWLRYEQNSRFHVEPSGKLKIADMRHREGVLFHLNVGRKMELFAVEKVILRDGFACQLCVPARSNEYADAGKPLPIKIVFQGTILNPLSIERDANISGPGYDLWTRETVSLVLPELQDLMMKLRAAYPGMTFEWEAIGHSLGAADAQNFLSYTAQALLIRELPEEWIHRIHLYTYNAAGVPVDTAKRFNLCFKERWHLVGKLMHSLVKNDLVSRGGEAMLGLELPCPEKLKLVEIHNCGVYHVLVNHCDFNHSWTDTILPRRILDSKGSASTYLRRSAHSWKDFSHHAKGLISENPIAQVATGCLYIIGAVFFNYQLALMAEGLMFMGGALISTGVRIVHLEGDVYTRAQIRDTVGDIWKTASNQWADNQVLERRD